MAGGMGRTVGQKRLQPGGRPGPTGPKRRKASKQAHTPEALAKKVYHAKKALVRASQKWKAKNVASTKRRLKQAATAHAALVAKEKEGQEVASKTFANVRKKLAAATTDAALMKELDLELLWDRWVSKVAGGIDCSAFISPSHLASCQQPTPTPGDATEERRKELLFQKLESAASIQEPLRALKIELGRLKGAVIELERQREREEGADAPESSNDEMQASGEEKSLSHDTSDDSDTSSNEEKPPGMKEHESASDSFSSDAVVDNSSSSDDSDGNADRGFVVGVPDFGEEFSSDGDEAVIPRDAAMHVDLSNLSDSSSVAGQSSASSSSTDSDTTASEDSRAEKDASSSSSEAGEDGFEIQVPFEVKADDHKEFASIPRDEMVLAVMDESDSSDDATQSSTDGVPRSSSPATSKKNTNMAKERKERKRKAKSADAALASSLFVASLSGEPVTSHKKQAKEPLSKAEKAKKKAKKNRKGQRARQKEWEEKFGREAKHLKKAPKKKVAHASDHATPAPDLHPSWASRKAAAQKISLGGFKGKKIVFGGDDTPARTAADPVQTKGPKKQDFSKVHPSWASRQKKESIGLGTAKGSRITFDD